MNPQHKPLCVVFDCMVFVQAVANRNSVAARALKLMETDEIKVFVSKQILTEIRDVLTRSKLRQALPGITDTTVEALFIQLERKSYFAADVPKAFEYPRDPKDEPYIDLAAAVDADYIVSRDSDLLDLMTGHSNDCKKFRQRFRKLKVIEPIDLLEMVKAINKSSEGMN